MIVYEISICFVLTLIIQKDLKVFFSTDGAFSIETGLELSGIAGPVR